ncbi:hypothetical protein ACN28S_47620 [Cystobacter fuscus]
MVVQLRVGVERVVVIVVGEGNDTLVLPGLERAHRADLRVRQLPQLPVLAAPELAPGALVQLGIHMGELRVGAQRAELLELRVGGRRAAEVEQEAVVGEARVVMAHVVLGILARLAAAGVHGHAVGVRREGAALDLLEVGHAITVGVLRLDGLERRGKRGREVPVGQGARRVGHRWGSRLAPKTLRCGGAT